MHWQFTQDDDIDPKTDVTYRTRNLFSGAKSRFPYFISDVPHLLKNCTKLFIEFWQWSVYQLHVEWSYVFTMEPCC